eukprot:1880510-Pyramimonas_sp.AAC.1
MGSGREASTTPRINHALGCITFSSVGMPSSGCASPRAFWEYPDRPERSMKTRAVTRKSKGN